MEFKQRLCRLCKEAGSSATPGPFWNARVVELKNGTGTGSCFALTNLLEILAFASAIMDAVTKQLLVGVAIETRSDD